MRLRARDEALLLQLMLLAAGLERLFVHDLDQPSYSFGKKRGLLQLAGAPDAGCPCPSAGCAETAHVGALLLEEPLMPRDGAARAGPATRSA